MQRMVLVVVVVGAIAAAALLSRTANAPGLAAQGATPAATPTAAGVEAELADLRARVAALATQVAELGGADREAVRGRLGGSRAGFDDLYGRPAAYLAPDEVGYDVPAVGRVTVRFAGDRATRIVAAAPRADDARLDKPDPADWPEERALEVASQFAPADAVTGEPVAGELAFVVSGASEALAGAMTAPDAAGCPVGGAQPFTATFTQAGPDLVSAIVVETAAPGAGTRLPAEPVPAEEGQLARAGSRAAATSSLGGTVSVNGVRVIAAAARADAPGPRPAAEGFAFFTVDLRLANETEQPLSYEPSDFILIDRRGRELTAICGGIEPSIARGEARPGEEIAGVVSFEAPERFRAERFVVLVDGARVGFDLR
jgi:hypothetical protein